VAAQVAVACWPAAAVPAGTTELTSETVSNHVRSAAGSKIPSDRTGVQDKRLCGAERGRRALARPWIPGRALKRIRELLEEPLAARTSAQAICAGGVKKRLGWAVEKNADSFDRLAAKKTGGRRLRSGCEAAGARDVEPIAAEELAGLGSAAGGAGGFVGGHAVHRVWGVGANAAPRWGSPANRT
jgi:hypothetical protein